MIIDYEIIEMLEEIEEKKELIKRKEKEILRQLKDICDFKIYYVKIKYSTEFEAVLEVCIYNDFYEDEDSFYFSREKLKNAEYIKQTIKENKTSPKRSIIY